MEFHGWEMGAEEEMVRKVQEGLTLSAGAAGRLWREKASHESVGETRIYSGNGEISNLVQMCRREWGEECWKEKLAKIWRALTTKPRFYT